MKELVNDFATVSCAPSLILRRSIAPGHIKQLMQINSGRKHSEEYNTINENQITSLRKLSCSSCDRNSVVVRARINKFSTFHRTNTHTHSCTEISLRTVFLLVIITLFQYLFSFRLSRDTIYDLTLFFAELLLTSNASAS